MAKKKLSPAPGQMAYLNKEFMESDAGRPLRILSEFYEPQQVFEQEEIKNSIVFFGSARTLPPDEIKKRRKGCKDKKELARLASNVKLAQGSAALDPHAGHVH